VAACCFFGSALATGFFSATFFSTFGYSFGASWCLDSLAFLILFNNSEYFLIDSLVFFQDSTFSFL